MNRVMTMVEPNAREEVYERVLYRPVIDKIKRKYSIGSERDVAYVDAFINCDPSSSWQRVAKFLYQHHHLAAVEEVRTYLPPRGEFRCDDLYDLYCFLIA